MHAKIGGRLINLKDYSSAGWIDIPADGPPDDAGSFPTRRAYEVRYGDHGEVFEGDVAQAIAELLERNAQLEFVPSMTTKPAFRGIVGVLHAPRLC